MVFSSILFLFAFLPIALAAYYSTWMISRGSAILSCLILTLLSITFYYFGSGSLVYLLLASVLFNWYFGQKIAASTSLRGRRYMLLIGILANVSVLVYFKYTRFILDNLSAVFGRVLVPDFHPPLPVGVSFFTFMCVAYLVDIYKKRHVPATLNSYATYLTLFPHLVAGPIIRFSEIAPDLATRPLTSSETFLRGVFRFAQGLGMKVLIADNLAPVADRIFATPANELSASVAWLGALTYTFQIYFDFAGYSAMAIGLALMFGFYFPENFDQPYLAKSITEFWRRWHMTLSRFFRDYLYIPLGGNRSGTWRTYLNLLIVFLVCGLWHGAAWTFVVWGLFHGGLLVAERVAERRYGYVGSGLAGLFLTFTLTIIGWVFFRSNTLGEAIDFTFAMFNLSTSVTHLPIAVYTDGATFATLILAGVFAFTPASILKGRGRRLSRFAAICSCTALLFLGSAYSLTNSYKPFIYFRF